MNLGQANCLIMPTSQSHHLRNATSRTIYGNQFSIGGEETDMEPISAIAMSLALGAGAVAGKEVVSALVKDAYATLKGLLKSRYPKVSVDHLEQAPASKARRASLEEDLTATNAGQDSEVMAAAMKLIEVIQQHAPSAAAAIGVDLKDVSAANLRLADIAAAGTGVKVERGTFTADIDIRGVRAGVPTSDPPKPS
jgi:hypothetical protein